MPEDLGKELLVESTKTVAVEAYNDTLKPALKVTGSLLALPLQIVDAALTKPKAWVAAQQYNYKRTLQLLAGKLEHTPPEKIVPPENYVAVPALQQISYCYDSSELRDMYANLPVSSMNEDKKWDVHPSYVDIIKQLAPDEAKLLKSLPRNVTLYNPLIDLQIDLGAGKGQHTVYRNYSNICDNVCDAPKNVSQYLENLCRLKLIDIPDDLYIPDEKYYFPLENSPEIMALKQEPLDEGCSYTVKKKLFHVTNYGLAFIKCCIDG